MARSKILAACIASILALACACATRSTAPVPAKADALPPGRGLTILNAACTSCHGLNEVTKFRGFYNRAQWRDVIVTMVEYGATMSAADVETLADYLDQQLGRR